MQGWWCRETYWRNGRKNGGEAGGCPGRPKEPLLDHLPKVHNDFIGTSCEMRHWRCRLQISLVQVDDWQTPTSVSGSSRTSSEIQLDVRDIAVHARPRSSYTGDIPTVCSTERLSFIYFVQDFQFFSINIFIYRSNWSIKKFKWRFTFDKCIIRNRNIMTNIRLMCAYGGSYCKI